jgi:hypothetical protein
VLAIHFAPRPLRTGPDVVFSAHALRRGSALPGGERGPPPTVAVADRHVGRGDTRGVGGWTGQDQVRSPRTEHWRGSAASRRRESAEHLPVGDDGSRPRPEPRRTARTPRPCQERRTRSPVRRGDRSALPRRAGRPREGRRTGHAARRRTGRRQRLAAGGGGQLDAGGRSHPRGGGHPGPRPQSAQPASSVTACGSRRAAGPKARGAGPELPRLRERRTRDGSWSGRTIRDAQRLGLRGGERHGAT